VAEPYREIAHLVQSISRMLLAAKPMTSTRNLCVAEPYREIAHLVQSISQREQVLRFWKETCLTVLPCAVDDASQRLQVEVLALALPHDGTK
jgi:hypothetical protein